MAPVEYSNKYHWPMEIVQAITKDRYSHEDDLPSDFSASTLINPIQLTALKARYPDQLKKQDVSDLFWAFMGSLAHAVIEENHAKEEGLKVEQRLYADCLGKTISGKLDCYLNGEIKDYKTTKAYKIIKGDYESWEQQLNVYAWLLAKNNLPVKKLNIIAIIFDWKEMETFKKDYPKSQIVQIPLRLWSLEEQETYVRKQVSALLAAAHLDDDQLFKTFPCSDKDKWSDIKDYAIMKSGATRASKCFQDPVEAQITCNKMTGRNYRVVARKTPPIRCLRYCHVAHKCAQFAMEQPKEDLDGEEP